MYSFHGFEETVEEVTQNVGDLSQQLMLEVEEDDVTELLQSYGEELPAEDLIELENQMTQEEEDTPQELRQLTSKGLAKVFSLVDEAMGILVVRILTWPGRLGLPERSVIS